jgi:acetolactate synthase-1/2/3 large subunit
LNYAEIIAKTLAMYEIEHFFFVPGDPSDLFVALEDANIRLILARSEKAAAYMADGYARVSYRPSVCYGQQGPGATNLAAGLAEPYFASSPTIAITHGHPPHMLAKNIYQGVDQLQVFRAVTKWNMPLTNLYHAPMMLRLAFSEATTGNPGPVHLFVPMDIAESAAEVQPFADKIFCRYPAIRSRPDYTKVVQAAAILVNSERPIMVAGNGAMISQAWNEVLEIATLMSMPVATTLSSKGIIPENHPLSIGVVGAYGSKLANRLLEDTDLVLYVGCATGDIATDGWTLPRLGTKVIQIDIEPSELGRNYVTEVPLFGDAKLGLQDLITALKELQAGMKGTRTNQIQQFAKEWMDIRNAEMSSDAVPIRPPRVIKEIRSSTKPDDILVADTGFMAGWTGVYYNTQVVGRTYLRSTGSLGWAFPAALGASLAVPGRRVVCVTGDGGIGYHLPDLETALRCEIPTVTVILNNQTLGFVYNTLKNFYGGRAYAACDYYDVNYADVALAYGAFGVRVERPAEIKDAIKEAFESGKPSIVEVMTDKNSIGPASYFEKMRKKMTT